MAICKYKIIVFHGNFSILSAFSIEMFEQIRHLYCNLQYAGSAVASLDISIKIIIFNTKIIILNKSFINLNTNRYPTISVGEPQRVRCD